MPIYDLTYRGWRGMRTKLPAFFPILENTVRLAFRNKLLFWLYLACAIPPIIACGILYIRYSLESAGFDQQLRGRHGNPVAFDMPRYFNFLGFQGGLAVAIAGVVGSQAIAGDRRGNSLESIFARAIRRSDYLWGRFFGLFALVLGATLIPGVVIWICDNAFSLDPNRMRMTLAYPIRIATWALMISASSSLLILAFSALIRRGWLAVAAYIAFLILSSGITGAIANIFERSNRELCDAILGFGYFPGMMGVQREIFGLRKDTVAFDASATTGAIMLIGLAFLSWLILLRKVRPIEVVS
jgi:ABC-type transport system involved in multi-copper enzyme maturation permease subunit